MGRKQKVTKIDNSSQKKLRVCMGFAFLFLFLLVFRIAFLQFVEGAELKEKAVNNQLSSKTIAANRGTIYDSTGKALAISAGVDTVTINPTQIEYKNGEKVNKEILAHSFSEIFGLDYNETLEKLNGDSNFTLAYKVESIKIEALRSWMQEKRHRVYSCQQQSPYLVFLHVSIPALPFGLSPGQGCRLIRSHRANRRRTIPCFHAVF